MKYVIDNLVRFCVLAALYCAFVLNSEGLLNVLLLYVWLMIVLGTCLGCLVFAMSVAGLDLKNLDYGSSPKWAHYLGVFFWVFVAFVFAFYGHLITSAFVLASIFMLALARELSNKQKETIPLD